MFVTNWNSTTKIQKISEITNFFRHYFLSRTEVVDIDDKTYQFRIINPELWIGMEGIEQKDNTLIAVPERAFLDMVYLSAGNCYFDNLHPLNKTKVKQLLPLYKSKALMERVTKLLNLK